MPLYLAMGIFELLFDLTQLLAEIADRFLKLNRLEADLVVVESFCVCDFFDALFSDSNNLPLLAVSPDFVQAF